VRLFRKYASQVFTFKQRPLRLVFAKKFCQKNNQSDRDDVNVKFQNGESIEINKDSDSVNLSQIQGTRSSASGYMVASFTCKKCETKNTKKFSKQTYQEGIVLIQCDGCKGLHLIADNLGWFEDENTNIEQILKSKGVEYTKRTAVDEIQFKTKKKRIGL